MDIYNDFRQTFFEILMEEDNDDDDVLSLFFFGSCTGKVKFKRCHLPLVNDFFKGRTMTPGCSVCVQRKDLIYQHVVIDVDLKGVEGGNVNLTDFGYNAYLRVRDTTPEKYILQDSEFQIDYNTVIVENFAYEILFILRSILKIDWIDIYVMVKKNMCMRSGFHIEIPDLILPYHDVEILGSIMRRLIPNTKLLDNPCNYSIFGSEKYPNCPYSPKYKMNSRGEINNFEEGGDHLFDTFSITKTLHPDTPVYGFKIMHRHFSIPRITNVERDESIPEIRRVRRKKIIEQRNDNDDSSCFVNIGYLEYNNKKKRLSLYKRIILNPEEDFVRYKDIDTTFLNLKNIIPRAQELEDNNLAIRAFIKQKKIRICLNPGRHLKKDFVNFTNKRNVPLALMRVDHHHKDHHQEDNPSPFDPFTLKHISELSRLNARMRDTVYYLMVVYMLSDASLCDQTSAMMEEWFAEHNNARFINLYWELNEKRNRGILTLKSHHQTWALLSLKILLINNDVVVDDKQIVEEKFKYIKTASGILKIPDLILCLLFNEYPYEFHNALFYELFSLYIPILPTHIWRRDSWKDRSNNNNVKILKQITDTFPELLHIFNIIIPYVRSLHKDNTTTKTLTLQSLVSKIEAYWSDVKSPDQVPDVFMCLPDCWYLLGCGDLIGIHPIPAYKLPAYSPVHSDSFSIEELYNHTNSCKFLHNQLFPIMSEIAKQDEEQAANTYNIEKTSNQSLRKDINARTEFTDTFEDLDLQIEMEITSNLSSNQVRSSQSCGNYKSNYSNLCRDEFCLQFAETLWRRTTTRNLAKLVKWHVLKVVCSSYRNMDAVLKGGGDAILKEYAHQTDSQRRQTVGRRMEAVARAMRDSILDHPDMSHELSKDILAVEEMTPLECDCAVTEAFVYLLQTFSYDVSAIRYLFGNCILPAICYGSNLRLKQVHFFLGNTNCGKTQFLNVLLSVFGHAAGILSSHTANQGSGQDRIHDLGKWCESAKFWFMDEITKKSFNRQLINQITGNSPLFLRTNYSDGRLVKVAPSLFIFGNNKPTFNENCPALLSRCKYFIFRSQFQKGGPFSFKYCKFPQMQNSLERVSAGILVIFLKATCCYDDPFYLYNVMTVVQVPRNVLDATAMYSEVVDIVHKLCQLCGVMEQPTGMILVKRFGYLITNLHNSNVLKYTKIASESDALKFISQVYVMSKLEIEGEYLTIFQGIAEIDVEQNDQLLLSVNNMGRKIKF